MIWHFFEVWMLMVVAFAIGCPIGAVAYRLIAASPLSDLQGDFADVVGDIVDGAKSRLGIGPVWRPEYRRIIERAPHAPQEPTGRREPTFDGLLGPGGQSRLPGGVVPAMISDQSDMPKAADAAASAAVALALGRLPAPVANEDVAMARPVGLAAPRNGVPDDLQRIRGIGRRIEHRLNRFGIFHFGQIAAWTPAEMRWVADRLAFPDRIQRDDWIGQAIVLAAGGDTGFVKSVDRRRRRRRERAFAAMVEAGPSIEEEAVLVVKAGASPPETVSSPETVPVVEAKPHDDGGAAGPDKAEAEAAAVVEEKAAPSSAAELAVPDLAPGDEETAAADDDGASGKDRPA